MYRALGQPPGTTPSKAAKFLIVRFGLHPLLYRPVTAISTGEIRKVLLARALATRPSLLVLDNAFDGLDVSSRAVLAELLSATLKGFSNLLVQGIDASATAHTQVLLITHRHEELVDEIATCSRFDDHGQLLTEPRDGRSARALMRAALGPAVDDEGGMVDSSASHATDASRAAERALLDLWGSAARGAHGATLVEANDLRVVRSGTALLHGLEWRVHRGEHWLVAGGNGAGKSTLSKLLALRDGVGQGADGDLSVLGEWLCASAASSAATPLSPSTRPAEAGALEHVGGVGGGRGDSLAARAATGVDAGAPAVQRAGVGWVSTELHLQLARSPRRAGDILTDDGNADALAAAPHVAGYLGLDDSLLRRPFACLSQGEQKLVLLAGAIAKRPALLVLDEPCQGLDLLSRRRVLALVETVCRAADVNLVYITHYYEEVLPCVTHIIHLHAGSVAFSGERAAYEASGLVGNASPAAGA